MLSHPEASLTLLHRTPRCPSRCCRSGHPRLWSPCLRPGCPSGPGLPSVLHRAQPREAEGGPYTVCVWVCSSHLPKVTKLPTGQSVLPSKETLPVLCAVTSVRDTGAPSCFYSPCSFNTVAPTFLPQRLWGCAGRTRVGLGSGLWFWGLQPGHVSSQEVRVPVTVQGQAVAG